MKRNKKLLVDISLEINQSDIHCEDASFIIIKKEIDGKQLIIKLPVLEGDTAEGLKKGYISDHYCVHGWWIRQKTKKDPKQKNGLSLALAQK
jgi:hypothetical protein